MMSQDPAALQKKLSDLQRVGEERAAERAAASNGYPYVDVRTLAVSPEAIKLIPEEKAKAAGVAVLQLKVKNVALGAGDPTTLAVEEVMRMLEKDGFTVKLFTISHAGLTEAWEAYKFVALEAENISGKVSIKKERLAELAGKLKSIEAVRKEIGSMGFASLATTALFEIILSGALANRTSDIHLEAATEKMAKMRYRIDGVLQDVFDAFPPKQYRALISRVKLLSGLKINVQDEAQDGRFTIGVGAKDIEVRVSVIPAEFGETVVMRLLDPDSIAIGLDALGLRADDLAIVNAELEKPNGLILNTGPTGSGKTTTLYAFLNYVNKPGSKLITIEDPIEYHLAGVEQTQVDPEAGYTFANGLRSILRQDPDIVLVGEIRDKETADIALQAALTGHLVFSTLHTNDAVGAVPRFYDLDVKPATIGAALSLVIAQRLVRRLCRDCKKEIPVGDDLKKKITAFFASLPARVDRAPYGAFIGKDGARTAKLYAPAGCDACNHLGYKGRLGVFEFFAAGPELEGTIIKEVSEVALKKLADKQAMVTMQQDGILKTLSGVTTLEEVEGVTGPLRW